MIFRSLPRLLILFLLGALVACSGSKTLSSHYVDQDITVDGTLSDWPYGDAVLHQSEYFTYYVTNDKQYVYLYVQFKNGFYQGAVQQSGFTIYLSGNPENKKALGITYPLGAFNALRDMPGTYDQFLNNQDWITKPEHQELLKKLRKENYQRVMITRREHKDAHAQNRILPVEQLRAQGLQIAADTTKRYLNLELRIPVHSSRTQQMALDPNGNGPIAVGFAIEPPDIKVEDTNNTGNVTRRGTYGRGTYGGAYGRRNDAVSVKRRMAMRMGEYSKWFTVKLQKAPSN